MSIKLHHEVIVFHNHNIMSHKLAYYAMTNSKIPIQLSFIDLL